MMLAPLLGAALVVAVATEPPTTNQADNGGLSAEQKSAATEPLVRSATECIVHAVTTNPHYKAGTALGDLIVASMPTCLTRVRAMIDAYDRVYGEGTGEAFFMGPYLDILPKAVMTAGKKAEQ